jgi:protoporphyrinogen oxidase
MCEPYTSKIWKIDPSKISADWAEQRFQGIRLIELMKTILIKLIKLDFSSYSLKDDSLAPDGGEFYYGETGAQEIPDGFTRILKKNGALILTKVKVKGIKVNSREVEFIYNGELKKIIACEKIVSTIPLHDLYEYIDRKESSIGRSLQEGLEYMNIIFVYLLLNKDHVSNDHWLYFPDRDIVFNRSVEFKNWSDQMCPDGKTAICLDITCFEGDELWTLSKEKLVERCIKDVEKVNLIEKTDVFDSLVLKIKNAYPYYDLDYMTKLQNIIKFIESNGCILCLGRTGRFYYTNSDGSIEMGMDLAKRLVNEESGVSALDWEIRKVSY